MEQFLSLVGMQAMKLAVRSGIVLTSSYALKQYSHLLTTVSDEQLSDELRKLQGDLDCKIQIITPAINLIELRSGQGNSALESALALTTSIQREIALLGHKMASLTAAQTNQATIRRLITDISALIKRVDGSIPLLQLAISASGESLSTSLPDSVSPSRMLQASAFLMIADSHFITNPQARVQVGPEFVVSVYMIFKGYSYLPSKETFGRAAQAVDLDNVKKPTWQEVLHKARLRLHRAPCLSHQERRNGLTAPSAYSYQLEIAEDRDDGRLHDTPKSSTEPSTSDIIAIPEITKLLYTNSAAILNIRDDLEACTTPILLLKRESNSANASQSPRLDTSDDETQQHVDCQLLSECSATPAHDQDDEPDTEPADIEPSNNSQFPSYLDSEWIALEMYSGDLSDDSQPDRSDTESTPTDSDESELETDNKATDNGGVLDQIRSLSIDQDQCNEEKSPLQYTTTSVGQSAPQPNSLFSTVTTSLSLLELVIRLAALQETQQQSHLSVPDHVLTCFLNGNTATK